MGASPQQHWSSEISCIQKEYQKRPDHPSTEDLHIALHEYGVGNADWDHNFDF